MSGDAEPREAGDANGGEAPSTSASRNASGGESPASFADLGLCEPLVEACTRLGWKASTPIQREAIPSALQGELAPCLALLP